MKTYIVRVNINLGEYITEVTIKAESLIEIDRYSVKADGVVIKFKESIYDIQEEC